MAIMRTHIYGIYLTVAKLSCCGWLCTDSLVRSKDPVYYCNAYPPMVVGRSQLYRMNINSKVGTGKDWLDLYHTVSALAMPVLLDSWSYVQTQKIAY